MAPRGLKQGNTHQSQYEFEYPSRVKTHLSGERTRLACWFRRLAETNLS